MAPALCLLAACASPGRREVGPVVAAIRALPLDSLCARGRRVCESIEIDPRVRCAPEVWPGNPGRRAVAFELTQSDVAGILATPKPRLRTLGDVVQPGGASVRLWLFVVDSTVQPRTVSAYVALPDSTSFVALVRLRLKRSGWAPLEVNVVEP